MCLQSQVKRYKKTVDALNLNKTIVQCVTAHDHAKKDVHRQVSLATLLDLSMHLSQFFAKLRLIND